MGSPPGVSKTKSVEAKAEYDREEVFAEKVSEFWASFRDGRVDCLPIQVKVLGIWSALAERYTPNMCIIGHQSGVLEGAAIIGIPVFYLKNERSKMGIKPKHSNSHSQTGTPVTKSPVTTSPATKDKPGQAQSLFSRFKELPIEFQTPLEEARLKDAIIKVVNDVIASRENLEKEQAKAAEEEESFLARRRKSNLKNFLGPEHESTENKEWKDPQRRKFFWDASVVKEPSSDRLHELADVMDTLIPV